MTFQLKLNRASDNRSTNQISFWCFKALWRNCTPHTAPYAGCLEGCLDTPLVDMQPLQILLFSDKYGLNNFEKYRKAMLLFFTLWSNTINLYGNKSTADHGLFYPSRSSFGWLLYSLSKDTSAWRTAHFAVTDRFKCVGWQVTRSFVHSNVFKSRLYCKQNMKTAGLDIKHAGILNPVRAWM